MVLALLLAHQELGTARRVVANVGEFLPRHRGHSGAVQPGAMCWPGKGATNRRARGTATYRTLSAWRKAYWPSSGTVGGACAHHQGVVRAKRGLLGPWP